MKRYAGIAFLVAAVGCSVWCGRSAVHSQEARRSAPLRFAVAVLPFASSARISVTGPEMDADAYRAVREKGDGPSKLAAEYLTRSGQVAGIVATEEPLRLASLQLQGAILNFHHRPVENMPGHWEAHVELGVELSRSKDGSELFSGFFEGTAPAQGPLAKGAAVDVLRRGIGAYQDKPLGKAFLQALKKALDGSGEREGDEATGVLPYISNLAWEADVVERTGRSIHINAGTRNGLQKGLQLVPFSEVSEPGISPERSRLPGVLRVEELGPHHAILEADGDALGGGQRLAGVYAPAGVDGFTKAVLHISGVPKEFRIPLLRKIENLEIYVLRHPGSITVTGTGEPTSKGLIVRLTFQHQGRNIARWDGVIPPGADAGVQAARCIDVIEPKLRSAGIPPANDRPAVRAIPVAQGAAVGVPRRDLRNRRQAFRADLSYAPGQRVPPDNVFRAGDIVNFEFSTSQDGYGVIYNFDAEGNLTQVWPYSNGEPRAGRVTRGVPAVLRGRIANVLGQELLVAIVWRSAERAQELVGSRPDTLLKLKQQIRRIASQARGKNQQTIDAEPVHAVLVAMRNRAHQAAGRLAGEENGEYAVAYLEYSSTR